MGFSLQGLELTRQLLQRHVHAVGTGEFQTHVLVRIASWRMERLRKDFTTPFQASNYRMENGRTYEVGGAEGRDGVRNRFERRRLQVGE